MVKFSSLVKCIYQCFTFLFNKIKNNNKNKKEQVPGLMPRTGYGPVCPTTGSFCYFTLVLVTCRAIGVLLLPLDGVLVHYSFNSPTPQHSGTHLYTWVERGTVRVKSLVQENNTMSPARAQTQTA